MAVMAVSPLPLRGLDHSIVYEWPVRLEAVVTDITALRLPFKRGQWRNGSRAQDPAESVLDAQMTAESGSLPARLCAAHQTCAAGRKHNYSHRKRRSNGVLGRREQGFGK
jgi:hypothetical protein